MKNLNGKEKALLLVVSVAVLGAVIAFLPDVSQALAQQAQQPGTWITEVDCNGSPEMIVITNTASEPQNLESWRLESDPPAEESLDLTALAIIWPTQSIMIESGPQAEAAFTWSRKQVLRNDDSTDFVRIVDNLGTTRQEVACAAPPVVTPTPSATVLAAVATPTVGGVVPDGGGRPEAPGLDVISPTAAVGAGSAMVAVSVLLFAAVWFSGISGRRRTRAAEVADSMVFARMDVAEITPEPEIKIEPEPVVVAAPAVLKHDNSTQRAVLIALIIVLVTMALAVLVLQPRENNRR